MSEQFNMDGYLSAVLGTRMGARFGGIVNARALYDKGGVYARVVDLPAERALARGVVIEHDEERLVLNELDRLNAMAACTEALRWSLLDGGGALLLITDQGALNEELNPGALNQILELRPISVLQMSSSSSTYSDPSKPKYGEPIWFTITPQVGTSYDVHESRVIPLPGAKSSSVLARRVPFQGRSDVDRPYEALDRYDEALRKTVQILERKQQAVYQMAGMAKSLADASRPNTVNVAEATVQRRISFVDSARGVLNTVAVDKDDAYQIQDLSLTGLKDVIGELQVAVSAEAGVPATLLFGRSPAGMNATGDADFRGYNERIEGLQSRRLRPALERLVSLVLVQNSLQGGKPDEWNVTFPSLTEMTDKERAEVQEIASRTELNELKSLEVAVGLSVVSQEQAVAWLEERELFGLEQAAADSTRREGVAYAQST